MTLCAGNLTAGDRGSSVADSSDNSGGDPLTTGAKRPPTLATVHGVTPLFKQMSAGRWSAFAFLTQLVDRELKVVVFVDVHLVFMMFGWYLTMFTWYLMTIRHLFRIPPFCRVLCFTGGVFRPD